MSRRDPMSYMCIVILLCSVVVCVVASHNISSQITGREKTSGRDIKLNVVAQTVTDGKVVDGTILTSAQELPILAIVPIMFGAIFGFSAGYFWRK